MVWHIATTVNTQYAMVPTTGNTMLTLEYGTALNTMVWYLHTTVNTKGWYHCQHYGMVPTIVNTILE